MNKFLLTIAFTLLLASGLVAQSDPASQFMNGKNLFNLGKYELAMEAMKELTTQSDNSYAAYGSFFYALSAYRLSQKFVARSMFLQILDRFPQWGKNEEVHYWLAEIYFSEKNYLKGLEELSKMKDNKQISSLKKYHLSKIEGLDTLQHLLEKNSYDQDIAIILADKINEQPYILQDRTLLEFLVDEFKLDAEKYNVANSMKSEFRDEYNISVLFPFMNDNLNPIKHEVNTPFLLDLYQGMRVGVDSLKVEGIPINLHAFDTRGDSLELIKILENAQIEKSDLLVGPLLPQTSKIASSYSYGKRINMVNPLSSNAQVIGNNPYSFLLMPTREKIALKAAEYSVQSFANKTAAIYYSPKDSISAAIYKERLEIDSFEVIIMKAIPDTLSKSILSELTYTDDYDNLRIKEDSLGHIYLVSSSELVVSNMISAIEIRRDEVPLIVRDDILKFKSISLVQLERLGVRLISFNSINPEREKYRQFTKDYKNRYGKIPSHYVYMGFELIYFFGKQLYEGGTLFQQIFNKESKDYEGYFLNGFNYFQSNSNQYIPMLEIKESVLSIIEPGFPVEEEEDE